MKWFRPDAEPQAVLPAQGEVRHSLALNALYHRLDSQRRYNVLDLGRACSQNVEFFSQFCGKIYIEDLLSTLSSFDYLSPEDGTSLDAVFEYLLPYQSTTRFDIVFSWDLFNYLEPDSFRHLIGYLSRFCPPGALIFSLISTLESIPDKPGTYRIQDSETLQYPAPGTILRRCPCYQEPDLLRLMPGFRVCNSFLLRNGFKEYLFIRRR